MANPYHSRTTGRFISGPGGGGAIMVTGGVSRLGGSRVGGVVLTSTRRGGGSIRAYPGRSRGTFIGKIGPGGKLSAPNKVTGAYLRAHRYPGTKISIGSPVGGNRNVRYVSRINAVASLTGGGALGIRAAGRATSRHGARGINAGRIPKSGYIVARAPRVRG